MRRQQQQQQRGSTGGGSGSVARPQQQHPATMLAAMLRKSATRAPAVAQQPANSLPSQLSQGSGAPALAKAHCKRKLPSNSQAMSASEPAISAAASVSVERRAQSPVGQSPTAPAATAARRKRKQPRDSRAPSVSAAAMAGTASMSRERPVRAAAAAAIGYMADLAEGELEDLDVTPTPSKRRKTGKSNCERSVADRCVMWQTSPTANTNMHQGADFSLPYPPTLAAHANTTVMF
jgi:hypothetical protein